MNAVKRKERDVAKPEWGTKRTCPKCGTRFYDLQKDDPATCIDCGNQWAPEPVLKAKQPIVVAEKEKKKKKKKKKKKLGGKKYIKKKKKNEQKKKREDEIEERIIKKKE
eukprot:TRINITY_DN23974_c0_g1_i3.p2 TRINITY_DN23974_c0_g1~~TRINITY_DN23974_c0_g1_i3.p2  ORF type:complete len:109 (+),score=37.55 TRINITY_DN23974_c0_g1_i3:287-613(+)